MVAPTEATVAAVTKATMAVEEALKTNDGSTVVLMDAPSDDMVAPPMATKLELEEVIKSKKRKVTKLTSEIGNFESAWKKLDSETNI